MTRLHRRVRQDGCTCGNRQAPGHAPGCPVRPMRRPDPAIPCMVDLDCYMGNGHDGDHAYAAIPDPGLAIEDAIETASDGGEL